MLEHLLTWSLALIPLMFSPGATNILVASTGASFGLRQSTPLIVGINVGLALQIAVIALGINSFFEQHPVVFMLLHYLGVIYIFYLAYHFFNAPHSINNTEEVLTKKSAFIEGVLIEILNPKVWVSLIVIFAAFAKDITIISNGSSWFAATTITLNLLNNLMWAILGAYIIRKLCTGSFAKMQNYAYGFMLAAVGFWMLIDAIK